MKKRVVITGISGLSSLGHDWACIKQNLQSSKTGVRFLSDWDKIEGMRTSLAAPIQKAPFENRWPRKKTRTMGTVSKYAVYTSEIALEESGLKENPLLQAGRAGVAYGSSFGSTDALSEFGDLMFNQKITKLNGTSYIRIMGHTAPVNISVFFGLQGRIIPTSTACTSGSMAIGYASEAIRYGSQDVMLAGGGEELCPSMAAVFDVLYATSIKNDHPELTPCPYDAERDGLVIGEGACTFVLESYEHAKRRNANIIAELVGFGTNTDGGHITKPNAKTMENAMRLSLKDAQLCPEDIGFISGHGTATVHGDIEESKATYAVFGGEVPIHSLKGHFGHTLGACGALESWLTIEMMRDGWFPPTANLSSIDPNCAPLNYIKEKEGRFLKTEYIMCNNFAFGGINTSLIFKKV